jgi:hypothetical protein
MPGAEGGCRSYAQKPWQVRLQLAGIGPLTKLHPEAASSPEQSHVPVPGPAGTQDGGWHAPPPAGHGGHAG